MTDDERGCKITCWCRNDDPDPAGAMRWYDNTTEGETS